MLRPKLDQLDAPGPPPCSSTMVLGVADAGLVVVQPHVVADLRVPRGRLERDLLLLCGFGGERRHQTIVSCGGSPNSLLPKIR